MGKFQVMIKPGLGDRVRALHEAGHVVANWLFGIETTRAWIGEHADGRVDQIGKARRMDLIRAKLAGVAVWVLEWQDARLLPKVNQSNFDKLGSSDDYLGAVCLMQEGWPGTFAETDWRLTLAWHDVIGLLSEHGREIHAIADALLRKHELSGDEIKAILGECPARDRAQIDKP